MRRISWTCRQNCCLADTPALPPHLASDHPLASAAPGQGSQKGLSSPSSGSAAGSQPAMHLESTVPHSLCTMPLAPKPQMLVHSRTVCIPRPALAVIGITLAPSGDRPHLHAPADPDVPNPGPRRGWVAARLLLVVPRLDQPTSSLPLKVTGAIAAALGPNPAAKPSACPQPQTRRKQRRQYCAAGQASADCACAVSSPPINDLLVMSQAPPLACGCWWHPKPSGHPQPPPPPQRQR